MAFWADFAIKKGQNGGVQNGSKVPSLNDMFLIRRLWYSIMEYPDEGGFSREEGRKRGKVILTE